MLLEVWKKGYEFVLDIMASMLNKNLQNHSPTGVRQNSCSANMQQIYRRTTTWKCDFNKVAMQLQRNHTSAWVLFSLLAAYL